MNVRFVAARVMSMVVVLGTVSLGAVGPEPVWPARGLRIADAEAIEALATCYDHSKTCQQMVDEIRATPMVVYVQRGQCRVGQGGSCLRFLTTAAGIRYLVIVLDQDLIGHALVAVAAHELQHVVEVVRAPEVVDVPSFHSLYARIGTLLGASRQREDWETAEAQRVAVVVRNDVRRSQRAAVLARNGK